MSSSGKNLRRPAVQGESLRSPAWTESLKKGLREAISTARLDWEPLPGWNAGGSTTTTSAAPSHVPNPVQSLRFDEPMSAHTTFKVGGPADVWFAAANAGEIVAALRFCRAHGMPCTLLGNGSNVLVSDRGIRGLTLAINSRFAGIGRLKPQDEEIYVLSGTRLASVSAFAAQDSLTGLEFASGIPGTLGGAVLMNAGAYGPSMADVVQRTDYLDARLEIRQLTGDEHQFAYRRSFFSDGSKIILGSWLRLKRGSQLEILANMADLAQRRRTSQPLEMPSAGSIFKRPPDNFAGKLISDCGLRGRRIGGAEVSRKHAGFIVNAGDATATDVRDLIREVRRTVAEHTGVMLEPEIRPVGDWGDEPFLQEVYDGPAACV